jgi:hypothetical protein
MIEKHERRRKQRHHLNGEGRGTDAAALDAGGAALGSIGLMAFALVVWLFAERCGLLILTVAAIGWFFVSITIWRLQRALPRCGAQRIVSQ